MTKIDLFRNSAEAESLEPGGILFRAGDQGDELMFAVVEGEIDLIIHGSVIETVGSGGILGELSLIDPAPRSATATARTAARVVRVDKKHFVFLVQEHPTFALQVMKIMAERLRKTNDATTAVTSE